MNDNRTFERHSISRLAFANSSDSGESQGGILKNISACGALIDLVFPLRKVPSEFGEEMPVDVNIDKFPPLKGHVVRSTRDLVAISFELDGKEQKILLKEIVQALESDGNLTAFA